MSGTLCKAHYLQSKVDPNKLRPLSSHVVAAARRLILSLLCRSSRRAGHTGTGGQAEDAVHFSNSLTSRQHLRILFFAAAAPLGGYRFRDGDRDIVGATRKKTSSQKKNGEVSEEEGGLLRCYPPASTQ
jgi:hypothetical protein